MRKSYLIRDNAFWPLIRHLVDRFGFPNFFEELVIYPDQRPNFRVTLTNRNLSWAWSDADAPPTRYQRSKYRIFMSPFDLKSNLLFVATHYGNTGRISISPTFSFVAKNHALTIKARPTSLVGPIFSVEVDDDSIQHSDALRVCPGTSYGIA